MSKKKAFSGSTMTLKDFHGGSIPSDLPLPSAPGVIVRPSDRPGFDRQMPTSWGNPMGRSDHRSRPGSSGATRNFDEKASLLSHPTHIGRNFDEDERKPLDGVSVPRRTVSDESSVPPGRPEQKADSMSAGKLTGKISTSVSHSPGVSPSSFPARFTGAAATGMNSHIQAGTNGQASASSHPNAWGTRKEVVGVCEPVPSAALSGPSVITRFAQASALEKVSSGRWQTKHPIHHSPDIEVIRYSDSESDFHLKANNACIGIAPFSERGDHDAMRGRYTERGHIADDAAHGSGRELPDYERLRSPLYLEAKDRVRSSIYPEVKDGSLPIYPNAVRPASTEGKFAGSQTPAPMSPEVSERPKLKLLPRSKPLDTSEAPAVEFKEQGYQSVHVEVISESFANANPPKPGSAGAEMGIQTVERPKLNLKPRSQRLEQAQEAAERERKALFGGARPREFVLKERGIDDVTINNLDTTQQPTRAKNELGKTETKPEVAVPSARYGDRAENFTLDQRIGRNSERKDHQLDNEKTEMQRGSWRNENRRNIRETEKQQERRSEPETWRKPVEQAKPSLPDAPGLRYGKAATALELAQAFSRSISDAKAADRLSGQMGQPGRNQIPFSRLTDTRDFYSGPTRRRQINGY
ncbi:uncharacterized protein LOC122059614 isoform X2 [Macadamia integrifolia]|uniref:uncharacterized protein LOC122059614 isoform X2 n=1 Tax=Macadamia integrifolia TaxID=60698 RepID=UPI001C532CBC|nr:uncharacterized protein LOC122059614 isoform X2 [Macadamia integrifolia]XP_042478446.1 uncharacterized protein LOC122059614 isoform X2 [Macadamia integrifolia]